MIDMYEKANEWITNRLNSAIEKLSFNKTIVGVIINDNYGSSGEYLISYNNLRFYAYSHFTDLKTGDYVYILIPNGNFDEQKIIISKQFRGGRNK